MGRRGLDTEQARLAAHVAATDLLEQANRFFLKRNGSLDDGRTESPDKRVTVRRVEDAVTVEVDFHPVSLPHDLVSSSVTVEFPVDTRELPRIEEDWATETRMGTKTIPIRQFPEIIGDVLDLIPSA